MDKKTQANYFECNKCGRKIKKVCPSDILCSAVEKCSKCGSTMKHVNNMYNQSKFTKKV